MRRTASNVIRFRSGPRPGSSANTGNNKNSSSSNGNNNNKNSSSSSNGNNNNNSGSGNSSGVQHRQRAADGNRQDQIRQDQDGQQKKQGADDEGRESGRSLHQEVGGEEQGGCTVKASALFLSTRVVLLLLILVH